MVTNYFLEEFAVNKCLSLPIKKDESDSSHSFMNILRGIETIETITVKANY